MNQTTGRTRALLVAGGVLVALGAYLLLERVLGPLFAPLGAVLQVLGAVAWPIALIAIGLALLGRGRLDDGVGGVYRSRSERVVGGVLGGVATRLGTDAWLVRVVFFVVAFATGFGAAALLYVAALILLPEAPLAGVAAATAPPVPSSAGGV
jgi:phage shock protein PspC (stress-responsive transcriptional regulator)